jgi:hypothetical protein
MLRSESAQANAKLRQDFTLLTNGHAIYLVRVGCLHWQDRMGLTVSTAAVVLCGAERL